MKLSDRKRITNTRIKIEKAARFIADSDGFTDYNLIIMLNPPRMRLATRYELEEVKFNQVCDVVCDYFDIDYNVVFMKSRIQPLCTVRQIIWYLGKEFHEIENSMMGRLTGYDHSTVSHGIKIIRNQIEVDKNIAKKVEEIYGLLTNI